MIQRSIKVKPSSDGILTVTLKAGETPQIFIKQGLKGMFLWYEGWEITPPDDDVVHTFHFVKNGEFVNNSWVWMQSIKDGKYYQVFKG